MVQKVFIDFNHYNKSEYYENEQGLIVNLYGLMYYNSSLDSIRNLILKGEQLLFVSSYEVFYQGFRKFLLDGHTLSYSEHARFRRILENVYYILAVLNKQEWVPSPEPSYDGTQRNVMRFGIVELRVIEDFLYSPQLLEQNFFALLRDIKANKFTIRPQKKSTVKWLPNNDIAFNLQALMTNAGYYVNYNEKLAFKELQEWCQNYLSAITDFPSFVVPSVHPYFMPTLQYIYKSSNRLSEHLEFPGTFSFYEAIKGKKILFLTPFADLISKQYNSGNIFKLYKNRQLPEFELTTLDMPLSFYPSRPGEGWLNTYQLCCEQISNHLSQAKFDLFIASAGCYGLPLCNFVYKNYSVNTLYYGNHMNTLFGIAQQCSKDFMLDDKSTEAWVAGDLGVRCPQVKNVDDGRYL